MGESWNISSFFHSKTSDTSIRFKNSKSNQVSCIQSVLFECRVHLHYVKFTKWVQVKLKSPTWFGEISFRIRSCVRTCLQILHVDTIWKGRRAKNEKKLAHKSRDFMVRIYSPSKGWQMIVKFTREYNSQLWRFKIGKLSRRKKYRKERTNDNFCTSHHFPLHTCELFYHADLRTTISVIVNPKVINLHDKSYIIHEPDIEISISLTITQISMNFKIALAKKEIGIENYNFINQLS